MDGEPVWVVPLNDFDILPANYLVNAYEEQIVVDKFGAYLDFPHRLPVHLPQLLQGQGRVGRMPQSLILRRQLHNQLRRRWWM